MQLFKVTLQLLETVLQYPMQVTSVGGQLMELWADIL